MDKKSDKEKAQRSHPGLGTEYEVLVPAYFCLKLVESEDVEDFSLLSNAEGFGDVDDLILHIKRRGQSELLFAFQLKHAGGANTKLSPDAFWNADEKNAFKGSFNLAKYCKTYSKFDDKKKEYRIIVFTNRTLELANAEKVLNFTMKQDDNCDGRIYFDTSKNKSIYKFTLNDTSKFPPDLSQNEFQRFFEKLSVYTSQSNSKELEIKIRDIFLNNYFVDESSARDYITFFRSWHKNEFKDLKLTKKDVEIQLIQILLKKCTKRRFPIVKPYGDCRKNDVLKRVVNSFNITLLNTLGILKEDENNDAEENKIVEKDSKTPEEKKLLEDAKKNKIAKRDAENLTPEEHYNALICTGRIPVVVEYKNSTKKLIGLVLNNPLIRSKDIPIKMIICGEKIDLNELTSFNVFNNLEDVRLKDENLFVEVLKNFRISLQGRGEILMKEIIDEEVSEFITAEDLIKSSIDELTIIGSKCETVMEHYVPRILETICIPFEHIIQIKEDLMVISCGNEFEKVERRLRRNKQKKVFKIGEFLDKVKSASSSQEFSEEYKSAIVLTQSEVKMELFSKFPGSIHFLKAVDENSFQLIMTIGDIKNLRNITKSRMIKGVLEEDLFNIFKNNNVNVICAEPGMGKSVLMEVLKKYSPRDHWAVKIDFRECSQIFKAFDKDHQWEDLFYKKIFEKDESVRMKVEEILLKRKKIYLFFDGLDELQSSYIETAIKFVQTLISRGFKIWVSSRRNLQDLLETRLNVFALNIQGFSEETQRNYIKNRLSSFYESKEIEAITEKIFENAKVFNNSEILGIPLQLSMLTEILIQDRDLGREFNEKIFVMTEMFESFLDGKITHYLKKSTLNPEMLLEDYIERQKKNYKRCYHYFEIAALKSCLDESFYETLNIPEPTDYREFIEEDLSELGIITKITEDGVPVFQHNTYGEYFVAWYFAKHYENIDLKRLFERKYSNIRLMFDIKLAEDSLPHLAVIYKDVDRLATFEGDITGVDKGGRNLLHLASCYYGEKFPLLDVKNLLINNNPRIKIFLNKKLELLNVKIIKFLQNKQISAIDKDKVFKWNCLQYCDAVLNLSTIDMLLIDESVDLIAFESLEKYLANYECLFFYASMFNFKNIFIMLKRLLLVNSKIDSFQNILKLRTMFNGETLLHVAAHKGRVDMIELLLNEGVDVNEKDEIGDTALHSAVHLNLARNRVKTVEMLLAPTSEYGDTPELVAVASLKILQLLLERGADLTAINNLGETVLHLSAMSKNVRLCELVFKLFSERNIDVNVKNSKGQSVLHVAVECSDLKVVKFLLSRNEIDFESRDHQGNTPLHYAAGLESLEMFELLLEKGADLKAKNNFGHTLFETQLHMTVRGRELDFKLSSERNINVNVKNSEGQNALHTAVGSDNLELFQFLLSHEEIDLESRDEDGNTLLHYAAELASLEMFELLLERGADLKAINNFGNTVLHMSARNKDVRCCELVFKLFSERDIDVNVKNSQGRSVLHTAVRNDNLEIVKFLLSHEEIDFESKDDQGSTPLHLAATFASLEMFELLLERGADLKAINNFGDTVLHISAFHKEVRCCELVFKLFSEQNIDVNVKNSIGRSVLHVAVARDNLEIVKFLLSHEEIDFESRDDQGSTPLHYAATFASLEMFELLLERGADLKAINNFGDTVLHISAFHKEVRYCELVFKLFSEQNIDVNVKNSIGRSVLHVAVARDNLEIVKFLLLHEDIDFESKDDQGSTPLHYAATFASLEMFELLLERGADLKAINNFGDTVLHISAFHKEVRCCELVFKLFSERNIDVNVKNSKGRSVLHVAVARDNLEIVKFLLLHEDIDFESKDDQGSTPLHFAATFASLEMFELLLERGADLKAINNFGDTVLHISAFHKEVRCCELVFKLFSEQNIDVNGKNSKGLSVLHVAVGEDNLEIVKFLLLHEDIDFESRDDEGSTPLHFAAAFASLEMFELLLERGADLKAINNFGDTVLHRSACNKEVRCCELVFKLFSERNIDVNVKNSKGRSVLHVAVACDNLEIVKFLLLHEDIDFESKDDQGSTPLHFAATFASLEMFELLLERGADLKAIDNFGNTVLHRSACNKEVRCCELVFKLFSERNIDVNVKNSNGQSALHLAIARDNLEIVKFLLSHEEIDFESRTDKGSTALHFAAEFASLEMFELLLERGADLKAIDNFGNTVLHATAYSKEVRWCKLVFKLFSERNIDVNVKNSIGRSVLHVAVARDNLEIVKFLLLHEDIDFESKDDQGNTPLHFAAAFASLEMFELLLERGADLKAIDNFGNTVLHATALNKEVRCCELVFKLFSEQNIDVNVKNSNGQSVLHLAVAEDNLEIVKFLLSHEEIDFESRNDQGYTPLHLAAFFARLEILKLLLEKGADLNVVDNDGDTVLHETPRNKDVRCCELVFKLFSEQNIDVNVKNLKGQSVLHVAVENDNLEHVRVLLSHEEIDSEARDKQGDTPLLVAARFARLEIFELLLERKADLKAINNLGDTVLHLLAMHKMSDAFKKLENEKSALHETIKQLVTAFKLLLTCQEIDIECKNELGNTPLLVAAAASYVQIFELLLKAGANSTAINYCGETVLHISAKHGNTDVMNFILGLGFDVDAVDNDGHTCLNYTETHQ